MDEDTGSLFFLPKMHLGYHETSQRERKIPLSFHFVAEVGLWLYLSRGKLAADRIPKSIMQNLNTE